MKKVLACIKYNKKIFFKIFFSLLLLFIVGIAFLIFQFRQFIPVISIAPQLLGFSGKQTYLLLFQNNAELRPGGGFIGSYAVATIDHAKIISFSVHNVYDADGLLVKHVEPYYIGRRYLQVHLYMRDSNFDVDFAQSAQKVASMLTLETGQQVDNVIAVDLSFVRSLVAVIAPIYIPEYNETMTADNFFILTETHADRNSFNGSTQKQDYLRALTAAIKMKLQENKIGYYIQFVPKVFDGISQKHVLIASTHPTIQQIFTRSNLSSTLSDTRINTPGTINDFLGINEANIGVNKANYYLKRTINHTATISASGSISEQVTITYTNTSPYQGWPTGRYLAYVRFILPLQSKLLGITIDNKQQHLVPAVTDFRVYEAPDFKPPQGLEVDHFDEEGKTLYGFTIMVGVLATKTVTVSYRLPDSLKVRTVPSRYNLFIFKQPGTDNDPYTLSLDYPTQYKISTASTITHVKQTSGKVSFFTPLSTDQHINVALTGR